MGQIGYAQRNESRVHGRRVYAGLKIHVSKQPAFHVPFKGNVTGKPNLQSFRMSRARVDLSQLKAIRRTADAGANRYGAQLRRLYSKTGSQQTRIVGLQRCGQIHL